jgi:hypothetical protein
MAVQESTGDAKSTKEMEFERNYGKLFARRQKRLIALAERQEQEKELERNIYAKYSPYAEPPIAKKTLAQLEATLHAARKVERGSCKFNERHPEVTGLPITTIMIIII